MQLFCPLCMVSFPQAGMCMLEQIATLHVSGLAMWLYRYESEFSYSIFRTLRDILENSLKTQRECTIGVIKL